MAERAGRVPYAIMVVDDDEGLQLYMKKILEGEYRVIQAFAAEEAFAHMDGDEVDLVLLDLMLPGISGINVCRRMKEHWRRRPVPVIALTARTDLETKVEALEAGADDYVTKPFHQKELLTRIKVQLRIRDLQKEIVSTERLKAMVETAVSANHEINNPLCAIINNVELLMSIPSVRSDHEVMKHLRAVFENAQRIESTTSKMANIIQPALAEYLPGITMLDIGRSGAKDEG